MADIIQVRAGNKANMPVLHDREIGYVRNENAFYIGTPGGNVKVGQNLEDALAAQQETIAQIQETATVQSEIIVAIGAALEEAQTTIEALGTTKLSASAAAAQSALAAEADIAAVVTAFNSLIAAMKASGLMTT